MEAWRPVAGTGEGEGRGHFCYMGQQVLVELHRAVQE